MSVKIKKLTAVFLCLLTFVLGACAIKLDPPEELTAEEEALNMGFSAVEYDDGIEIEAGGYTFLKVNIKLDYESEVKWSTSDPEIAVVDSNGRVDALKAGKATITAKAKSAVVDYEVSVVKAGKKTTSYSTAFTANESIAETNKVLSEERFTYAIIVNEYNCSVTVYTHVDNAYATPVRAMVCSTAKKPIITESGSSASGEVPSFTEVIGDKAEWVALNDGKYYRYATYIGDNLMFQSSPYSNESADSLITEEYNKIGTRATDKNIRLSVEDAKWIYDNCKEGTTVRIVNSPLKYFYSLGVPEGVKLTENSKSLNYDPTDRDKNNPYNKLAPEISGADNVVVEAEKGFDLYSGVTATDTCGNDITDKICIDGELDRNVEGRYVISYYVTDNLNRTARVDREIIITSDLEEYNATAPTE
ncbi:MAG: DUF5011 domain-containing protein [Clostridia bacterium]|nr:DUF5011 domain-containing protein [Clostridia bacterium]